MSTSSRSPIASSKVLSQPYAFYSLKIVHFHYYFVEELQEIQWMKLCSVLSPFSFEYPSVVPTC